MNATPQPYPQDSEQPKPLGPPVRIGRTIRFAVRAGWDGLGLVCLTSLTVFLAALIPATLVVRLGLSTDAALRLAGWGAALLSAVLILPPLVAGACWLANVFIEHDEPSYADLWTGARRLFSRAVALGAVHTLVSMMLAANLLFYLTRGSILFLILAVVFIYLSVFWAMQAIYHYPLLAATERGLLPRSESGSPPVLAVIRNALVLTLASPGYSFGLVLLLTALFVPCLISGAGLALVFPGFAAFLVMQATRDQLVRFGHLPPPPDPDEPVQDERWRLEPAPVQTEDDKDKPRDTAATGRDEA